MVQACTCKMAVTLHLTATVGYSVNVILLNISGELRTFLIDHSCALVKLHSVASLKSLNGRRLIWGREFFYCLSNVLPTGSLHVAYYKSRWNVKFEILHKGMHEILPPLILPMHQYFATHVLKMIHFCQFTIFAAILLTERKLIRENIEFFLKMLKSERNHWAFHKSVVQDLCKVKCASSAPETLMKHSDKIFIKMKKEESCTTRKNEQ